jgi:hypothetical protein
MYPKDDFYERMANCIKENCYYPGYPPLDDSGWTPAEFDVKKCAEILKEVFGGK